MFVLTACGAVISTTLTVAEDGSGSRVMVLTLPADDMDALVSGTAGVDASVRKNLPAELAYGGLQATADGGASATFTLTFTSTDDYKTKAAALLALGGDTTSTLEFAVTDSLLVKGVKIDEDFGSYGLLKWMFDGLLADGVVEESNASSMHEAGDTILNVGGVSVPQSSVYDYSNVADNGFASVTMATDIADSDAITRTIRYTTDPEKFASAEAVYDEFFAQSTPSDAEFEMVASGIWELSFTGSADVISTSTDTALGSTGSELALEFSGVSDDPATLLTTVTDTASCENICASDSDAVIIDTVTGGAKFAPAAIDLDTSASEPGVFNYTPAITSINAEFEFGMFGAVTATVAFVVDNDDVTLVGDGFAELFRPAKDIGTVTSTKGDSATTFTTVISGDDVATFAAAYEKWAPGSGFGALDNQGSNFFSHSVIYDVRAALDSVIKSHPVTGTATTSVKLPFGQSVDAATGSPTTEGGITGTTLTFDGSDTVSVRASGLTFAGLVTIAVVALLLVVGALLLVRYRRKVLAKLRTAKDRLGEALEPGELAAESAFQAEHAYSPNSAGSLFDVAASAPRADSAGSMLDWPQHDAVPAPSSSVFDLPPTTSHHDSARGASVLSLAPTTFVAASRASLFDLTDAHGTSRSGASTN